MHMVIIFQVMLFLLSDVNPIPRGHSAARPWETNFYVDQSSNNPFKKNAFETVVCKLLASLLRPEYTTRPCKNTMYH